MGIHGEQILLSTESIQLENSTGSIINPAKDETLATLQSMLVTLERIASQSPQLNRTKEMMVNVGNSFGGAYTTSVINANSNFASGVTFSRVNETINFSNMGANHLYRNIT